MWDQLVITLRSTCENQISFRCQGLFFPPLLSLPHLSPLLSFLSLSLSFLPNIAHPLFLFLFVFSVLEWPGILLSGYRSPDSLYSFRFLCLQWLTFYPCLCCGHLPKGLLYCGQCLNRNRIKPLSHCLDQVRKQVCCRHPLLELKGSWVFLAPISSLLPTVHQSQIIHSTDLLPSSSSPSPLPIP